MINLLLIPLMAILSRMAGGGLGAHILDKKGHKKGIMPFGMTWLPEMSMALVIALVTSPHWGWWFFLPILAYTYFMIERGHGAVYRMNGWESSDPNRKDSIEIPVRPIFNLFGWSIYQPAYSWACMGLKGLAVGAAIFPFGLVMGALWPFSYWVKDSVWGEYLSGAFIGVCLVLFLIL